MSAAGIILFFYDGIFHTDISTFLHQLAPPDSTIIIVFQHPHLIQVTQMV